MSRSLRCCLFQLIEALIDPNAQDERAKRASRANGSAFINAGGIPLCVDLITSAHEAQERSVHVALKTELLTAVADEDMKAEWFYYPEDSRPEGSGQDSTCVDVHFLLANPIQCIPSTAGQLSATVGYVSPSLVNETMSSIPDQCGCLFLFCPFCCCFFHFAF